MPANYQDATGDWLPPGYYASTYTGLVTGQSGDLAMYKAASGHADGLYSADLEPDGVHPIIGGDTKRTLLQDGEYDGIYG